MYTIVLEESLGLHAFGPFLDQDDAMKWFLPKQAFLASTQAAGMILTAPFELPDMGLEEPSTFYHQGQSFDAQAEGFICVLVVSETSSFGIGPFDSRAEAASWYLDNCTRVGGAQGMILPLTRPVMAEVGV